MRLSIEITPEQHQHLKAAAALKGQSIKSYVLERALPVGEDKVALEKLESFLSPRLESAKQGKVSSLSVNDIFNDEMQKVK